VSQFCKQHLTSIEFFPSYFFVKDLRTGQTLLQGPNKNDIYEWPLTVPVQPSAMVGVKTSVNEWQKRLGHPSSRTLQSLLQKFSLPVSSKNICLTLCSSCQCNKSHKLPFTMSSLTSNGPLEIIFIDVWGPASVESIDQNKYFVIFVDHFTKYIWLYPIKYKYDVFTIFPTFKNLVENYFKTKIISIYSDGGGEFQKLKPFLAKFGISHLMTPPHTPQHNGIAKRRHHHIIETGLTLLYQSNLPLKFWSHAFQTATYLINRLPTPILHNRSPFHALFGDIPNYSKLRIFGCLCFPWLRPYNHHKPEPRSRPCIFLGYSLTQSAYKCFDTSQNRIFLSRHVVFDETVFPYLSFAQHPPFHSQFFSSIT